MLHGSCVAAGLLIFVSRYGAGYILFATGADSLGALALHRLAIHHDSSFGGVLAGGRIPMKIFAQSGARDICPAQDNAVIVAPAVRAGERLGHRAQKSCDS